MRLSKIKLAGFKSFVDPTVVPMPSNLIGIVGPNGCGKSNIIDAVRWVMGESSAKQIRGDSMADVIFNGSTARKPVGQASVELVFDNSDASLGGQYARYSEISIKRQVGRDGQSLYFLNNARCRRKDITDIFLGTGLGPRSYAIIEQGMISRLIEAKPDELRIFLEEAAGISKYKERRRETENRIRHTRDNINRLNDLRDELERRLEVLQRQAKAAERYRELKAEERELKAQLLAIRWQELKRESDEKTRQMEMLRNRYEARIADIRRAEAQLEEQRVIQAEASDHFNSIQGEFYGVGAEIARLEQAIHHARTQRQQHQAELQEVERAWRTTQTHIDADQARIRELSEHLAADSQQLQQARAAAQQSQEHLQDNEQAMTQWQQRWDEFNTRASEQLRAAEVERARIEHLEQQILDNARRRERIELELERLSHTDLQQAVGALQGEQERLVEEVETTGQALQMTAGHQEEVRQQLKQLRLTQEGLRERIQEARERLVSLQALQEEALGKNASQAGRWLQHHGLQGNRRLGEALEVETGWEQAVEWVLGDRLEAVCVDDWQDLSAALQRLDDGELTLLSMARRFPLQGSVSPDGGVLTPLVEKIRQPGILQAWFVHVYCADDLTAATAMLPQLSLHESIVTADGFWVSPGWCRVRRGARQQQSVLEREQLIQRLEGDLAEAGRQRTELEAQIVEAEERLESLLAGHEQLRRQLEHARQKLARVEAQLQAKKSRAQEISDRREQNQAELGALAGTLRHVEHELQAARRRLAEALAATEGHDSERAALLEERDTLREKLEQVRRQARHDQERCHQIELRFHSMETEKNGAVERLERARAQIAHLTRRRQELDDLLSGGETPIAALNEDLKKNLEKRVEVEEQLTQARRYSEQVDHGFRELTARRQEYEQDAERLRATLDEVKMLWQELRVRSQTILEQINEWGEDVQKITASLPPEADEQQWLERVEKIERQIQRLGAINLAAIDEYAEQQERKTYLDRQFEDLAEALATLENAIQKIDRETKARFKETYDRVNSGFKSMFPRLFGGGQAYLELTGEDLLDTGVTVMAQPPGKRNSTIHLLSGGEKALTAVALVFSIFELNPAPFCMLDEVDAPLDDANVGRFTDLVKEMSERIQFIFITHNKVTMEMAHQLMGVTMAEAGVSRLVAVDVDEAVELAAAS